MRQGEALLRVHHHAPVPVLEEVLARVAGAYALAGEAPPAVLLLLERLEARP